ncbi:MAG: oligosaccharide flippase family protein [Aquincola sp.]|nr:oligosaccharide flippase family protein [Aquincola sp.]
MSLKLNIAANYASQIYTTLIGIVLVPLYLRFMGSEAYGLLGFFSMLQAWFGLLDLGLTPTIARESARYQGGALSALEYRRVFRALSLLFGIVALGGGLLLVMAAQPIAQHWLKADALPLAEVVLAVQIMAACVALRWMGGLYRGVVSGSERLVWLSGFNALIATLRFGGVLASMWIWGFTAAVFFWHQIAVAALELIALSWASYRLLPGQRLLGGVIGWSLRPIRPLLSFALTIAFTSSVWVLVTQSDKLILSGILSLSEYGYYSLAVLVAGCITVLVSPVSAAILPRMARLHAQGEMDEVRRVYRNATQLVCAVAGCAALTLAVCAEPLLYAWTGDAQIVQAAAPILRLYAIGNGLLAVSAFPFYLQYARGQLRYHLIGNVIMVVMLVPAIVLASLHAGAVGAAWAWVALNVLYLLGWVGFVHSRLEPGLHLAWLGRDVLAIIGPAIVVGMLLGATFDDPGSRSASLMQTLAVFAVGALAAWMAASALRVRVSAEPQCEATRS